MLTDGYITDKTDGNWRYTNCGTKEGDRPNKNLPAYARVVINNDGIEGFTVDADGRSKPGAKILFKSPDELLSKAPADHPTAETVKEVRSKLYIKWIGVSPTNLKQIFIVWATPVAIINKAAIKKVGGPGDIEHISITGRLMVINMTEPIAIDAQEWWTLAFGAGAVGIYGSFKGDCSYDDTQAQPGTSDPVVPPEKPNVCDPAQATIGGGGGGGQGSAGGPINLVVGCCDPITSTSSTQAPKDPSANTNPLVFVGNKPFINVPARCTYPFCLVNLLICTDPECRTACPVWLICMQLFGSTEPMEIFPLDKLKDIDPCDINNEVQAYIGDTDAECCQDVQVQILGIYGEPVEEYGVWAPENTLPAYAGQAVTYTFKCETVCGVKCQSKVVGDPAQCYVDEDIIKPIPRTIPVEFFEPKKFKVTEIPVLTSELINLPTSTQISLPTSTQIDIVTSLSSTVIDIVTNVEVLPALPIVTQVDIAYKYLIDGNIANVGQSIPIVTSVESNKTDISRLVNNGTITMPLMQTFDLVYGNSLTLSTTPLAAILYPSFANLNVCDLSGNSTLISVITAISAVVTPAQLIYGSSLGMATALNVAKSTNTTTFIDWTSPDTISVVTQVTQHTTNAISQTVLNDSHSTAINVVTNAQKLEDLPVVTGGGTLEDKYIAYFDPANPNEPYVSKPGAQDRYISFNDPGAQKAEALVTDPNGDTEIPVHVPPDKQNCKVKWKFLLRDDQIVTANGARWIFDCCSRQKRQPSPYERDIEKWDCSDFVLTRAYYTFKQSGTELICPCWSGDAYDGAKDSGDLACGAVPEPYQPIMGPNPCTIRIRRVRRDYCTHC